LYNNLLPDDQNLCPKCTEQLRRDAEALFKGDGWVYGPPRIYDCRFFPVNRIFEAVLLLQKQYVTQT